MMVTKKKSTITKEAKKGRVKIGKLKLSKETVKDLNARGIRKVMGGVIALLSKGTNGSTCKPPC
jgi:hypothetical protein